MSATVHALLEHWQTGSSSIAGDFPIDDSVLAHFPKGTEVLSANRHGSSAWTITARITTRLEDGTRKEYFLKCATEEVGHTMMEGEYWAMTGSSDPDPKMHSELYKFIPAAIPKPVARGKFRAQTPPTYFFLCEFVEMSNQTPDPDQLCARLVELHQISESPTGKFGFHVRTCQGRTPQAVEWETSWTSCFTNLMVYVIAEDVQTNGPWPDFEKAGSRTISHVVPRLVGALERNSRSVKPCLIHADLWEGNTGTSYETGDIILFDAGSYYAHNEMEIANWRCPYNKINARVYTKTYLKHFGPSEPVDEWDDRNRLYSVYYNIIYSVNHMVQGRSVRQMAYEDMCYLVDKFAP